MINYHSIRKLTILPPFITSNCVGVFFVRSLSIKYILLKAINYQTKLNYYYKKFSSHPFKNLLREDKKVKKGLMKPSKPHFFPTQIAAAFIVSISSTCHTFIILSFDGHFSLPLQMKIKTIINTLRKSDLLHYLKTLSNLIWLKGEISLSIFSHYSRSNWTRAQKNFPSSSLRLN